jgi:hypothetical protein
MNFSLPLKSERRPEVNRDYQLKNGEMNSLLKVPL